MKRWHDGQGTGERLNIADFENGGRYWIPGNMGGFQNSKEINSACVHFLLNLNKLPQIQWL